ncbi:hypothetical protein KIW84_030891 [Lathyrus oleraceus]|uniref:Protein kinase domain-containing protein n=1 Tax=Pisum sativum TaxID=3888 RepID=A0A9D5AZX3_PEA|nr:hypothetical protein KIW84_030891 [Pisum sativum]
MLYKSNTFSIFFVNLEFCIVSLIACFWFFPNNADILKKVQGLLLKWMLILSYLVLMIKFGAHGKTLEPPLLSAARSSLKHWNSHGSKYVLSHGAATIGALSPANPPIYGPLINPSHPPKSSHFSIQFKKRSEWKPPISGFKNIAPIHSTEAAVPSVLAQPPLTPHASNCCKQDMVLKRGGKGCHCVYPIKLDILLLNVSQSPDWDKFLEELATQLGLQNNTQIDLINFYVINFSTLNISMDITPHKGISFSANEASKINSSLSMHKVRLDPGLVGGYKLLNIIWFEPPPPTQAPTLTASPEKAPLYHSPTATSLSSSNKGGHSNLFLVLGIAIGMLFIAIVSILIFCLCTLLSKEKTPPIETEKPRTENAVSAGGSIPHPTSTRFIAFEELKEATNNFEPASVLGEGGFGKVFKGILSDGTSVAIKRLTNGGQQGDKEFLAEVEMLSRLHHRNLVKLVGYYSNRESSQNLLCYELVPNGSLEAWLHGPMGINCPLDWDTRMKIALDAARGLSYLHEDSQPCVIHRDFKASNILLENNFHAKVADFGLAKQAPEGGANYLSTRVMGTFGYVAPEYAMTGHLLVKSDVYSYGVVLLELLTGRKPVDMSQPSGQENLVTWTDP